MKKAAEQFQSEPASKRLTDEPILLFLKYLTYTYDTIRETQHSWAQNENIINVCGLFKMDLQDKTEKFRFNTELGLLYTTDQSVKCSHGEITFTYK